MNQNLGPQFPTSMSWDDVKDKHPLYSRFGFDHAVNELAHNHKEWDGTPQPLSYTESGVHPRDVRFQRYPASDPRVSEAIQGYKSGASVPPVLLVNRAGESLTADGHHRLSAAEILDRPVPAVVAQSPREDRYAGKAGIGYTKKRS